MSTDDRYLEMQEEKFERAFAEILGLTYDELCYLGYSIEDNVGHDDQVHCKIIRFQGDVDKYKHKIVLLENNQVCLELGAWNDLMASLGNHND